jgi:hypothetical protein
MYIFFKSLNELKTKYEGGIYERFKEVFGYIN